MNSNLFMALFLP